ncbi:flippase-like domain-containing protein [bacterium]|nr:flippase-like domain-containing protein [bacterium]
MRKIVTQLLKLAVSGALIALLLHKIGPATLLGSFRRIEPLWFACALLLFTASHFPGAFQWQRLLTAENVRIPFRHVLIMYFIGLFFNNFLIGGVGGDFYRMIDARRMSGKGTAAVSTVFLDRVMGLLILSGMAVFSAPFLLVQKKLPVTYQWILLLILLTWVLVMAFFFIRRFARLFSFLIRKLIPASLHLKSRDVYNSIYAFGRRRTLFLQVVCISVCVQTARILMHYFLCRSLGCTLSPVYFFLFVPVIAILASLPVSIGGIGLREQTGVLLFGAVGMAAMDAFTMEFLAYIVAIASSLPGGILFVFRRLGGAAVESKT